MRDKAIRWFVDVWRIWAVGEERNKTSKQPTDERYLGAGV